MAKKTTQNEEITEVEVKVIILLMMVIIIMMTVVGAQC